MLAWIALVCSTVGLVTSIMLIPRHRASLLIALLNILMMAVQIAYMAEHTQ